MDLTGNKHTDIISLIEDDDSPVTMQMFWPNTPEMSTVNMFLQQLQPEETNAHVEVCVQLCVRTRRTNQSEDPICQPLLLYILNFVSCVVVCVSHTEATQESRRRKTAKGELKA